MSKSYKLFSKHYLKYHVAPLPSYSGTPESLCRCTFYLCLKLRTTKLHPLSQITKSVFGR